MTMKELVKRFADEVRAKDLGAALRTGSEILQATAGFYELLFGGAVAAAEDLTDSEADLAALADDLSAATATAATNGKAIDPTLILALVDLILKIIAERRKSQV